MGETSDNSKEDGMNEEKPVQGGECDDCARRLEKSEDVSGYRCKIRSERNCIHKVKEEGKK